MDDHKIISIVQAEDKRAIGWDTTRLRADVERAREYYDGVMTDLPAIPDMSQSVSRDVMETVEAALPDIIDIFLSGEDVIEFTPHGEEDVEAAAQETDYINYVFQQENNGFLILYTFFKCAMQEKIGIVKTWWDDRVIQEEEKYFGIDDDELSVLQDDEEVEIKSLETAVGQETITDPHTGQEQQINIMSHDVVCERTSSAAKACVDPVPLHEFAWSSRTKTLQTTPYCRHKTMKTRSDLIEMGFEKSVINDLNASAPTTDTGKKYIGGQSTTSQDASQDEIEVTEHYIRIDMDGDGRSELWMITTAAQTIMSKERISRIPFAAISPIINPHQLLGMSLADLVMDLQRIKTHILRSLMNNVSLQNNQRPVVSQDYATTDTMNDILTVRDGSPIRVKGDARAALSWATNVDLSPTLLPVMEYADSIKENRTGITRNSQGMDPDTLNKAATTATGFAGLMTASQKRQKLIARIIAETGVKDMFINLHHLIQSYQDKEKVVRLRGKWTPVDPRQWKTRTDMTVNVGIGTGDKSQQLQFLNQIFQRQVEVWMQQGGKEGPLVSIQNVYDTLKKMVNASGFKTSDTFFTDPSTVPPQEPQEPPPDPVVVKAQIDAQATQQKAEIDAQVEKYKTDRSNEIKFYQINQELKLKAQIAGQELDLKESLGTRELILKGMKEEAHASIKASTALKTDVSIGGDPG